MKDGEVREGVSGCTRLLLCARKSDSRDALLFAAK